MNIKLDGLVITSKEILFTELKRQLKSDEFHGNNLDALYDVLMSTTIDLRIQLLNKELLETQLGSYYHALNKLFTEVSSSNEFVKIAK